MAIPTLKAVDLKRIGHGLNRPECVLCHASGAVFVSHFGGGVSRIQADGEPQHILGPGDPLVATNGFALTRRGDFLCASLLPPGGVWRIAQDGQQSPYLIEVDGLALSSVNFVYVDELDRVWVTISTQRQPRSLGYRPDVDDGLIILVDPQGARIVAEGLGFTNEAKLDVSGQWLYVNETFVRRTSRFRVGSNGQLGPKETVAEYGPGTFPDGLEFDEEGGLWITSILSNRVIRIAPDGTQQLILEDCDPDRMAELESIYQAGELDRPHMDQLDTQLKSLSSIAFGGADRQTAYLGNLLDDCIYSFRSPVAGIRPPHWKFAL